mgnify:CR=1 FL=1
MKKLSIIILLSITWPLAAQTEYQAKMHISESGNLPYRILLPKNFNQNDKYPLLLFLHGAGERGSDNKKQLVHGAEHFKSAQSAYPSIVLFPQCPKEDYWSNLTVDRSEMPYRFQFDYSQPPTPAMSHVMSLLDSLLNQEFVDQDRVYVGGLSMGGMGTFEILHRKPETFAAAFAICGAGDPESVSNYAKKTPVWLFHGGKDNVVLPSYSTEMYIALHKAGARPRYNLYKNANHNSWDPAFAEDDFISWIFSQKR